jgi:hypothetical protein
VTTISAALAQTTSAAKHTRATVTAGAAVADEHRGSATVAAGAPWGGGIARSTVTAGAAAAEEQPRCPTVAPAGPRSSRAVALTPVAEEEATVEAVRMCRGAISSIADEDIDHRDGTSKTEDGSGHPERISKVARTRQTSDA